jgi:hypothetical protein
MTISFFQSDWPGIRLTAGDARAAPVGAGVRANLAAGVLPGEQVEACQGRAGGWVLPGVLLSRVFPAAERDQAGSAALLPLAGKLNQ